MKSKKLIVLPLREVTFTQRQLALIARQFQPYNMRCRGELAALLSPDQFEECWRIRKLQNKRRSYDGDKINPLDVYDRRQIKKSAWKTTLRWSRAWYFNSSYRDHLADPIIKTWKYKSRVKYRLQLCHSQTQVKYESNRPACSYKVLDVTLTFDLLRQRWQWIGGMLTISAKTDAGKRAYPCWWFQQRHNSDGPCVGLEVKRGWIINGTYHVSAVNSEAEARKKKSSIIRRAKEKIVEARLKRERRETEFIEYQKQKSLLNYSAPRGWVNRLTSLQAGNCEGGTDNFIASRVAPFFQKAGFILGDLRGISIRAKTLLQIERSPLTRRVCLLSK